MTGYGESVIDFSTGDRVELHPATDLWMQGARYGNVLKPRQYHNTTMVLVKLDKKREPVYVVPSDLRRI